MSIASGKSRLLRQGGSDPGLHWRWTCGAINRRGVDDMQLRLRFVCLV